MACPSAGLPPAALWADPRVFAATFLDVPPSFSWPSPVGPSAAPGAVGQSAEDVPFLGPDPGWLATALFTPPAVQQPAGAGVTAAATPPGARTVEGPTRHERAAPRPARTYSRDELLDLRPSQNCGHTCVAFGTGWCAVFRALRVLLF